jgi:phage tail-like protein
MTEPVGNLQRFDPFKNFKFRFQWDGRIVAGISKVSGLRCTTKVITHREGGDLSAEHKLPGLTRSLRAS